MEYIALFYVACIVYIGFEAWRDPLIEVEHGDE